MKLTQPKKIINPIAAPVIFKKVFFAVNIGNTSIFGIKNINKNTITQDNIFSLKKNLNESNNSFIH